MDDKDLRSQLEGLFSDLEEPVGAQAVQPDSWGGASVPKPPAAAKGVQAEVTILGALADNAADGIAICNPDGRLTYVNRACCALFGYDHAQREMIGLELAALWPEGEGERLAQVLAQAMTGSWRGDARQRRKDGSLFDAAITVFPMSDGFEQPPALAAIIHDMTDRKRPEDALARERNLLRTLIDHLPDYIFVKDTEGRIVAHNAAYSRLGVTATPRERVGKTDFDLYPPEAAERYTAQEQQVMRSGQPLIETEERGVDANGAPRWYLTTKLPLRDAQGNIAGMVGIVRDTTERKQAEMERERLMEEIRASAERDQMLNAIAARIRANIALDQVLDATVREVGKALGTPRVAIWLEPMHGESGEGQA
jgi:PAS domain S-box-containing protein